MREASNGFAMLEGLALEEGVLMPADTRSAWESCPGGSHRPGELDWDFAETLLSRADGIPAGVGRSIKNAATSAASE